MNTETYAKFNTKSTEEKRQIQRAMESCKVDSSNIDEYVKFAFSFASKLSSTWSSSSIPVKEKIQKIIFPEGIFYNHQNEAFRTIKVNRVFELIPRLNSV